MGINAEYMGTTALTLLQRVATSTGIMKLFVVLSTASLAACMPAAQLLHPGLAALVPVGTHQWPGITTGDVDKTCFGCRPAVVAAIHGRKRRNAVPVAEAEAAAEPHGFLPGFLGHPYLPLHATALVGSSSFQTVDNNGAKYTTGVTALHPVLIHGRRKREAEAEAEPEAVAEPEAAAAIPFPVSPFVSLNGYTHSLPGDSYAAISTPNLYHALPHPLPLYPLFG